MKKLAIALGGVLVVFSATAAYLWLESAAQHDQNVAAAARVSAAELAQSSGSPALPPTQGLPNAVVSSATAPGNATQVGAATAASAASGTSAAAGTNPLAQAMQQLQNSPEGQEMTRIMVRQMLEQEYEDLAKEMNLSPDKAAKVLDLLAMRRMEQGTDMLSMSNSPQDRAAREQNARALAKREQAFQSELSALLGSSYPKWGEYQTKAAERQRAMYTRMGQEQLRDSINASGTPLTDAQFQYLNKALEAEQSRIDRETTSVQQQLQRLPETNRRLIEVASAHLNPRQLQQYRQYLQQQQETISMMDVMGGVP
jgi:hypothetical protein